MTNNEQLKTKTMNTLKLFFLVVLCTSYTIHSYATSYTWNGATSTSWATSTNWTPNGVPGAADNVTIVTATNQPTYNGIAGVTNITMTSGTLNLGGYTLNVSGAGTFNGGTVSNGKVNVSSTSTLTFAGTTMSCKVTGTISGHILLNGSVFNDTTRFTKTGGFTTSTVGGNKFNGYTVITNQSTSGFYLNNATPYKPDTANNIVVFNQENSGTLVFGASNTSPSVFYDKVILNKKTGSNSNPLEAGSHGKVEFRDTIEVTNVTTNDIFIGHYSESAVTLDGNATVVIGSAGYTGRYLYFRHWSKNNFTPINITLTGTAIFSALSDNIIQGNFTVNAPQIYTIESIYTGAVTFQKTGATDNWSGGDNIFYGEFSLTNNGSGALGFGTGATPDSFKLRATFITYNYNLSVAHDYTGHYFGGDVYFKALGTGSINVSNYGGATFKGNIYLASTSTGSINFGQSSSNTLSLSSGKTIIEDAAGFNSGNLLLRRFTKNGTTAMTLDFGSTAAVTIGPYSTINGAITYSGGNFYLNGCTFNHAAAFTKTGGTDAYSSGGNVFNSTASFTNQGTAALILANTSGDDFNGNVTFTKNANYNFYPGYVGTTSFSGNITYAGTYTGISLGKSTGLVVLDGGSAQTFTSRSGDYAKKLKINKTALGITLSGTLTISDSLILTNGIVSSSGSDMIVLEDNCKLGGVSDASHVAGKVKKIGNDAFTFPVGKNGQYRSIAISAPTNTTDAYTTEYFNENSNGLYSHSSKDASLAQLSTSEYWKLDRNSGTTNVNVTLSWECPTTSCGFSSTANLKVAAWNGTTWKDKGNNGTTGTTTAGTIITNASTTYGPYTLATSATFDCTCALATEFGSGNTCLTSQSLSSGEKWYKFLADEKTKQIRLSNKGALTTANIDKMQIYNSCGGTIIGGDTMKTTADTVLTSDVRALTVGNYYYIRTVKSATGTGNADYDICLKNGPEKSLTEHIDSPWSGCGLDFVQSSLRLNQRTQGGTTAGATSPEDFIIAGIPSTVTILNAYIWITTVDNVSIVPPGFPKVFDFQLDGSSLTANALGTSTFTGGTCWPNTATTNTFTLDVTAALVGTNGNHNFVFDIANATNYVGLGTIACDVTGATLLIVYRESCTAGVNEGKLVLWQGLDVLQAGDAAYTLTDLNAYAVNANEEAFMIISDLENSGTNYNINGSTPNTPITGNMHNFVTMTNPGGGYAANQDIVSFNTIGNGDCYAVSVIGAYTRDDSHTCFCEKVGSAFDLCDEDASDLIGLNGSNLVLNIPGSIIINGTMHIDADLTFQGCQNIFLGPSARIIVDAGFELNIIDSKINACAYMWDGIYASETGAEIIADGSYFISAENGIVSENGQNIEITDCFFERCYKGVGIRNYNPSLPSPPAFPGFIRGTTFNCTSPYLMAPYAGQRTFCGIEINTAYGVTIGAGASGANTFDNMRFGINANNSLVSVYNCDFTNIYRTSLNPGLLPLPLQEGAIFADNSGSSVLTSGAGLVVGASGTGVNSFNGCNFGVYSNRLKTNVEYNDFNNVLKGAWVQNLINGSTVSHNTFDNTAGWQGKGTAIQVEGIVGGAKTRLTIRDNPSITDFQTGILARNITSQSYSPNARPFWIYNNDIIFNLTNNTLNRYGIRVEKCNYAIVAKNSVVKNVNLQAGEYTRLRGISIANSNRALVYDNYPITKMGQGIYTTGSVTSTQFYCNQFNTNYNGFFFGPGTAISQQGSTAWNTDNQWISNLLPYDNATELGYIINSPVNWYYRLNGTTYNPYPIDPEILGINYTWNNHTTNRCGSAAEPPDAIVETPDEAEREAQFGAIMRNENEYDAYEDAYKQYDNEYAYLIFKNNPGWLTLGADDADYQNWYDSIETSNIGALLAVRELADSMLLMTDQAQWDASLVKANSDIAAITPNKLIETNEKNVMSIYLNTFAVDTFEFSKADSATLFNIAYQMGSEGGIAVYMARIMLNLDVDLGESNKTDEEFFQGEDGEENRSYTLYPNPAKDEVNVMFNGYEEGEEILIELYDITGRKSIDRLIYLSGNLVTINTSKLEKGVYLYNITVKRGDSGKGKLIITR